MARIASSPSTLTEIRMKAQKNAEARNTYGKRANFDMGRVVITFAERCAIDKHLNSTTKH